MASSLSNFVNNLAEGTHKVKSKHVHGNDKCKTCGIKYKNFECCLAYRNFEGDLIEYKCLCCNKNYQKSLIKT